MPPVQEMAQLQVSNNLYAFPPVDTSHTKFNKELSSHSSTGSTGNSSSAVPVNKLPTSTSSSAIQPSPSTTTKTGKHPTRSMSSPGQQSPRAVDPKSTHGSKNIPTRQKSESSGLNGAAAVKPRTVEEIQQRQRQQALQRQQTAEVSIGKDSTVQLQQPLGIVTEPLNVPTITPQQSAHRPAQQNSLPFHSGQQSTQQTKTKHANVSASRGQPKSPLPQAQAQKARQAHHRQPTSPPVTNQRPAREEQQTQSALSKNQSHSSSTSSPPLSIQPSPVLVESSNVKSNLPAESVSSEQQSDESDGFSVNEVIVSANAAVKADQPKTQRPTELVPPPTGTGGRSTGMVCLFCFFQCILSSY